MDIKALLKSVKWAEIPCEYCDVRVEETHETNITLSNREVTTAIAQSSLGAFLRLRKNGQWFYSATTDLMTLQEQLMELSRSTPFGEGSFWSQVPEYNSPYENIQHSSDNPFRVPLEKKMQLLKKYDAVTATNPFVKSGSSRYRDIYLVKTFLNSVGTFFQYDFSQCGGSVSYDLSEGDKKFTDRVSFYGTGFSDIENEIEKIQKHVQEATQFLHAPLVKPGKYRLLLSPVVTGVFVHESFGHMSEADGMLGDPLAKEVWKLGQKVAADFVSIVDSGYGGGSGYCPIDDEGFQTTETDLVKNGELAGRLHSYDTAQAFSEKTTGNGRSISFEYEPIVRMTSTYMKKGETPLGDLYRMAEGAILIEDFNYGTGGELFTIAPRRAYLVKNGMPELPIRVNVISGQLFETLLNIEALGDNFELHHSVLGGCGKSRQFPLPVSDGGPTILVKDMQVS